MERKGKERKVRKDSRVSNHAGTKGMGESSGKERRESEWSCRKKIDRSCRKEVRVSGNVGEGGRVSLYVGRKGRES